MAERPIAVVLKTIEVNASGGSNPSPSAIKKFTQVPVRSKRLRGLFFGGCLTRHFSELEKGRAAVLLASASSALMERTSKTFRERQSSCISGFYAVLLAFCLHFPLFPIGSPLAGEKVLC